MFSGKKASRLRKTFLSVLAEVQDCIGDLNDISVDEHLTAEIATEPASSTKEDRSRRAFAAGVLTGQEEARLNTVMAAAVTSFDRLASAKPLWKVAPMTSTNENPP